MPERDRLDALLVVSASLLMGALLFAVRSHLSPLVVAVAVVALLFPFRRQPVARHLLVVLLLLFVLWLVHELRDVLFPFGVSLLLAYLANPLVDRLARWRIPRLLSVTLLILTFIGLVVLALVLLVPRIAREVSDMVQASVQFAGVLRSWLDTDFLPLLARLGVDSSQLQSQFVPAIADQAQGLLKFIFQNLLQLTARLSTMLGQLLNLVLIPFLTFFLLKDYDKLKASVRRMVPERHKARVVTVVHAVDTVLAGFFRGELLVCLIVGTLTAVLLTIFGAPYALLLGLLAGILNLVPYVGLAITMAVGVLVGLLSPHPVLTTIKIVVLIESVQIVEGSFLSPKIVGERVGLHPAWVMFAILAFSKLWGLLGLVIAVPSAAVVAALLRSHHAQVHGGRVAPEVS
ncbi:MAG: AI-2E family transporter [candidate division KSB1 bacterium]|nr:AI-2E family transporter [candidate division KSB1 bacterium]